jgi:prolyl oligopeptidase
VRRFRCTQTGPIVIVAAICILWIAAPPATGEKPKYPPTRTVDVVDEVHGVEIPDPYRWLENKDDPEVLDWVEAQNDLAREMLDVYPALRARLTERLRQLFDVSQTWPPSIRGDRYFFYRHDGLQNHRVLYVRHGSYEAEPRLVIDPNTFSKDGTVAMDYCHTSPDGKLIAYGKSASGSERSTLYVRDVDAGKDLPEAIADAKWASVAWLKDGSAFFYSRLPSPGSVPPGDEDFYQKIYFHKVGGDPKQDVLVYGEGRPKLELCDVWTSSDDAYLFLETMTVWTKSDLFFKPNKLEGEFTPVAVGLDGLTSGDVVGDTLLLRTNVDAPRYRIVKTDVAHPGPDHWKDVVPQQEGVIEDWEVIGRDKLAVQIMENAYSRLYLYDFDGKRLKEIEMPALGTISGLSARWDGDELFFSFQSFVYPPTVYRYDLVADKLEVHDRVKLDLHPERYATKQVWYKSKDGTRVPMFIVYRKDLELDGSNPTLLYGYGGFDVSLTPSFRETSFLWMEMGGIFAMANIRGGGEFGREWHEAGRLANKQNVYDDFIAAAEYLIKERYTNPSKLAIQGGSNGGLLVGACLVQRPDLFQAVHCAVPLLDMIRFQRFSMAEHWVQEYGSSEDPEQFKYLIRWSPYQQVKKGVRYPAVLFTAGLADGRVAPIHAWKMAARLQADSASDRPILVMTETKAGHGQGKPLSMRIQEYVDEWTFLMTQLGMTDAGR